MNSPESVLPPVSAARKPWHAHLYVQVLIAIGLGVTLGILKPDWGAAMKPLADGFVRLIKMMITPIIFTTVVVGVAKIGDMKRVGRVGLKALIYFEVVSTLALVIGLVVINVLRPGVGMNVDPAELRKDMPKEVVKYIDEGKSKTLVQHILETIPEHVVGSFADGNILQVLFFSLLLGLAMIRMGQKALPLVDLLDQLAHVFFDMFGMVMRFAPIGAFGAMGYTVGKHGASALPRLGMLMLCVYVTCFLFIVIVLGTISRLAGFSLWQFIRYIKDEILFVLGTSSSESVLSRMMLKLENVGCDKSVVSLAIPTGYSFNLDGTSIYLTMAAIFLAQAMNVPLTLGEQLTILAVLLLTSKGSAGVTGAGFITLAATLSSTSVPVEGVLILLGIDRFMSEARAITNLIGNGVATMVVAKWDGSLDMERVRRVLANPSEALSENLEAVSDARADFALRVETPSDEPASPGAKISLDSE